MVNEYEGCVAKNLSKMSDLFLKVKYWSNMCSIFDQVMDRSDAHQASHNKPQSSSYDLESLSIFNIPKAKID